MLNQTILVEQKAFDLSYKIELFIDLTKINDFKCFTVLGLISIRTIFD